MTTGEQGPEGPPGDESLGEKIDRVSIQLEEVRVSYDREALKRDERIRKTEESIARSKDTTKWLKRSAAVALLAGFIGIGVGIGGIHAQNSTNANNKKARVASCLQYNRQQVQQAKAERDELRSLVDFASPAKLRTAEQQLKILKLEDIYDATVAKSHPPRDCSPSGISKYLSKQASS